jgi:peroxin-3
VEGSKNIKYVVISSIPYNFLIQYASALTRTLTTLYTTTLLSLLTSIQLALLARERYITSVLSTERAERISEAAPTLYGLVFREAVSRVVDVDMIWPAWSAGQEDWEEEVETISEETEMRFLTLSWWMLHVGWKDVAARVRGSVEAVFEGYVLSLGRCFTNFFMSEYLLKRNCHLLSSTH